MWRAEHRSQYLQVMHVQAWELRHAEHTLDSAHADEASEEVLSQAERLHILEQDVASCRKCALHQSRQQTVFGTGNPNADWLLIGEAPGADEDRLGEPFVGRAGKLLDAMLLAMGLERQQIFIANILKCRPPRNRDPNPEEILACSSFLNEQIALIQPKIILAIGRIAAQNLLKVTTPIGKLRGTRYDYKLGDSNIPLIVTYHPAYLLRSPSQKAKAWEDLTFAMHTFNTLS